MHHARGMKMPASGTSFALRMLVATFTKFAATRKEPLASNIARIHAGFLAAGFGEPSVRFRLSDGEFIGKTGVARVLKRWPELERFSRQGGLINVTGTGATEPVDFGLLLQIAQGVPRSFPFKAISLHFSAPGFSEGPELPPFADPSTMGMLMRAGVDIGGGSPMQPGVQVRDSWWVNGRQRSVWAMRIVEADPGAKKPPPLPAPVATVFAACGKARKSIQMPMAVAPVAPQPQTGEAVRAVIAEYRAKLAELLDVQPHDIPLQAFDSATRLTERSGPKKPELVRIFGPMSYDCVGESGTFTLRRRTAGNLTVKLTIEVGTWSDSTTGFMQVLGLVNGQGFKATLALPPSRQTAHGEMRGAVMWGQFPIGTPERWRHIVENLGALVAELDRTFVPAVEAVTGPSPAWYEPDRS